MARAFGEEVGGRGGSWLHLRWPESITISSSYVDLEDLTVTGRVSPQPPKQRSHIYARKIDTLTITHSSLYLSSLNRVKMPQAKP